MNLDYSKLGLKVGLEIHQQLDTPKLFCSCESTLHESKPDFTVKKRKLYAVAGELGNIDPAARQAYYRGKSYMYRIHHDSSCSVELDEEPPHNINKEALDIALSVALMLKANIMEELHIMRKTVVDGSNPAGFQRTSLFAINGKLETDGINIGIPTLCIEEDSARIIETREKEIIFNLDRLAIPLIEMATSPTIKSPEEARKVANALGDILRATRKVKRGIGTIRQDLNISIKDGARNEIKGIQDLSLIPKVVENEVLRQLNLLKIKDDLKKRKAKKLEFKRCPVLDIIKNTKSKILKKNYELGRAICVLKLEKFAGLLGTELQPGRRLGTEIAEYAKAYGAVGLMHSDELPAYGVTESEVKQIQEKLNLKKDDAFILISDREKFCDKSMKAAIDRINMAFDEVPKETRKALPDGNSTFMRPLPGGARMYPETDLRPIVITDKKLSELKKNLPAFPWKQISGLEEKYSLPNQIAQSLYRSRYFNLFNKLVKETKADPRVIAVTFTNTVKSFENSETLKEKHFSDLFKALSKNKFTKGAIPKIIEEWIKKPATPLEELLKKLSLEEVSDSELEKLIEKIVSENKKLIEERKERAIQPLMGLVMKEMRGKADGKLVMEILKKKVK